ncbi:hypothetical protein P3T29_006089 [Kitasatospora sp. MAP5-34]|nr:hypothetical protein [Kitasatospora sp. MAP5-34]
MLKARRIVVSALLLGIAMLLGAGPAMADSHWSLNSSTAAAVAQDSHW